MADYSNLIHSGGVSTVSDGGPSRGRGRLIVFILLCCLIFAGIWLYRRHSEDSAGKDGEPAQGSDAARPQPAQSDRMAPATQKPDTAPQPTVPPEVLAMARENVAAAVQALQSDEFVRAREHALKVIESQLKEGDQLWEQAAEVLSKANISIFMSDIPAPSKKLYTIQEGDNLIRIAKRFKTTVESIQKSNSLDPTNPVIFPGKTLYIYTGQWSVVVRKSLFRLYLNDGESLFKVYPIGIGRQGRTPSGVFRITSKQKEPVWYNEGRAIPYGAEDNVLGTRWMALQPIGDTDPNLRGYGIHGTWEPETIGSQSSNGCIRLTNDDVEELYSILPYNTEVTIID